MLLYYAQSNIGNVRSNNEDNLYCAGAMLTPETRDMPFSISGTADVPCLFAVCDGMGGQEDGEFASFAAVSNLAELEAAIKSAPPKDIDGLVQEYVTKTNTLLCEKMREKSVRIGTTLALVIVTGNEIRAYSIGDSRIYLIAGGGFRQLSNDHTLTAQKVKMGVLTEEQARNDHDRHKLTRYLGIFEEEMVIEAEPLPPLPLTEPYRLLLCSDGLTDLVNDERIAEILTDASVSDTAAMLTDEALAAGGKDNITCIVIDAAPQSDSPQSAGSNKFTRFLTGMMGLAGKKAKQTKE